jgi:hypothetical protein
MALAPKTEMINTTGKAAIATLQNGIIQKETVIDMPIGTPITAIGNFTNFAGSLYFRDVAGKLYNNKDFTIVGNEVVLAIPKEKEPAKTNYFLWFLGGLALWQVLKK